MKNITVICCIVCLCIGSSYAGCQEGEMCIDLDKTGATDGNIGGVSVVSKMTSLISRKPCSRQIVLKVHFLKTKRICPLTSGMSFPSQRLLKVQMYLSSGERKGFMFNIGDSRTNNGYAGDGATQTYDAELQGLSNSIHVYASDKCKSVMKYNHTGALNSQVSLVNFWIKDEYLKISNDNNGVLQNICDSCLYALNGQNDYEGQENEDIYIAANRVIAGAYRKGVGLCSMKLRWVNRP